jgi:streptogramin lyase
MTIVAALLVVAVLTYRFDHSHTPSSQLPRWVNGVPPVASALSFLALGVQLVASRVSRAQRKRLEAVYTAAGAAAAGSDLPTWLSWLRPGCSPVAGASAQVLTVIVLVASVGTTVAGASITTRLASISPRATPTATATATATPTPTGPHGQQTYTITDPALREANYITAAPDGSLWWGGQGAFGHLVAGGAMTSIPYPSAWSTGRFGDTVLAGPDGNLWFTEYTTASTPAAADHIGKITPSGTITEYAVTHANNGPDAMAIGPDGNIWFTEAGNGYSSSQPVQDGVIGRVTLSGAVKEYPIPVSNAHPAGLTKGPDNNLWFTVNIFSAPGAAGKPTTIANYVGRVTPTGSIALFKVIGSASTIGDIITGPDGALWFGLGNYQNTSGGQPGMIGRISPQGQFLPSISLASLNDPTAEYGLPSNFVVASNGAVYFGNFEYQTSATSGTVIYGPLIYVVTSGGQANTFAKVGNLECYAVSSGPGGSISCAEDSDIQTVLP